MSDSSDKNGAVLMSKSTNGNFYIEIEHANGDQVCQAIMDAETFAHAVTGKHVKVKLSVPGGQKTVQTNPALEEPTESIIEKEELTKEAFSARLYAESQGAFYPWWLCTHEEVKKSMIDNFDEAYSRWVSEELKQAKQRETDRDLSSIEIIDLKDGESPLDYMTKK